MLALLLKSMNYLLPSIAFFSNSNPKAHPKNAYVFEKM
ncbi:MAG: hypothetical protein OFPI_13970 [Osedax symbiont Rs2]|nr:MAG: hypothetical protein OFPI_13970 [Osedax symbiont Rs2]